MAILTNAQPEVTATNTVTLTNKTLTAPTISDPTFTGTTTNINTTNLVVEDKNIVINDVTSPTDANADGGGISLNGATTKSLNWVDATDAWTSSEHLNLASGKSYYVNGTLLKDVSETLTNKTLTSPVVSGLTLSDSSIILEGATANDFETTLTVTDPTADRTITFPDATGTVAFTSDITVTASSTNTFTNKSISLATNTVTATLAELNTAISDADVASLAGSETLTNKTLTSPITNTATHNNSLLKSPEERCTVSATAATGTIAFDTQTQGVLYYTTNASANFTLNFTNVDANLAVGDSISCVFLNTNGATAYYPTAFQVDSVGVTPKFSGGTAPSAGNASAIDAYSFTIIKTAAATFTVLAGGAVKFA
jgi:hypothetical protein